MLPRPTSISSIFDVLNTPKELGLQENDILHIRDMSKYQESRDKTIKYLLTEAGSQLGSDGILKLEVCINEDSAVTFNIRKVDLTTQVSSFEVRIIPTILQLCQLKRPQFYREDEFEDILAFLRVEYKLPDAGLSILFPTANKVDHYSPVLSWKDIGRLAHISSSCLLARKPRELSGNLNFIVVSPSYPLTIRRPGRNSTLLWANEMRCRATGITDWILVAL